MIDKEKRDFGKWWVWVLFLTVISALTFFTLSAVGLIGQTAIQREVFEQSYQRSAAEDAKLATFKAERIAIQAQLRRSDLGPSLRADYEAQLAAINFQINTIEGPK